MKNMLTLMILMFTLISYNVLAINIEILHYDRQNSSSDFYINCNAGFYPNNITKAGSNITYSCITDMTGNNSNGSFVIKTGDTMSGNLNMSDNNISDVNTLYVHNISGRSPIGVIGNLILNGYNISAENFFGNFGINATNITLIKNFSVTDIANQVTHTICLSNDTCYSTTFTDNVGSSYSADNNYLYLIGTQFNWNETKADNKYVLDINTVKTTGPLFCNGLSTSCQIGSGFNLSMTQNNGTVGGWISAMDWLKFNASLNQTQTDNLYYNRTYIDSVTLTTNYYPTSVLTIRGTNNSGNNIGNLSYMDNRYYNVSELSGVNPEEIDINYTINGTSFNNIQVLAQYSGTHAISIQLYDINSSTWETYGTISQSTSPIFLNIAVPDPSSHINTSTNITQLRFIHLPNGQSGQIFAIDESILQKGPATSSSQFDDDTGLYNASNPSGYINSSQDQNNYTITLSLTNTCDNSTNTTVSIEQDPVWQANSSLYYTKTQTEALSNLSNYYTKSSIDTIISSENSNNTNTFLRNNTQVNFTKVYVTTICFNGACTDNITGI